MSPPTPTPTPLIKCKTYSLRIYGYNDVNINVQTHKIFVLSIGSVLQLWRSCLLLLDRVTYISVNLSL